MLIIRINTITLIAFVCSQKNVALNIAFAGDKEFIRKLTEITLANLENEAFGGKEISRDVGASVTLLNKRLQFITHKTVNQFIREVRLQKAMQILQQEVFTAAEVALKVGFSSPAYFNTCFSEFFGITPGEVKRRSLNGTFDPGNTNSSKTESSFFNPPQSVPALKPTKKQVLRAILFAVPAILAIIILGHYFSHLFLTNAKAAIERRLEYQEKSIAVLPLINDSNDPENVYFINGVMEAILDNLCKIKGLKVHPRTSVEQYRKGNKTIREIGRELRVNYIIEGAGQKIGNEISLTIQLIEVDTENHLFSERYNEKLEDIFNLQGKIAIKVASEIEAVITLDEKELIEKSSTKSVAAWEMYSRGIELHNIADLENNIENYKRAGYYFKRAIQLDSTYADPYVQLGWICWSEDVLDSALFYCNKALHFDDKNSNAYILRGCLYEEQGLHEKAEEKFNLAIRYNPNCSPAYGLIGDLFYNRGDSYKAIKYKLKAIKLKSNSLEKRNNLISLWDSFNNVGLYEEAQKYAEKLITLTGDSTYLYWSLLQVDYNAGDYESVINYANKIYRADSLNLGKLLGFHHSYFLGNTYVNIRDYKEAGRMLENYVASMNRQGRKIQPYHYFGYIYLQNGQKEEADFHFQGSIKFRLKFIELNKPNEVSPPNLGITFIYAALGNKAKALEHLRVVNRCVPFLYTCAQITSFKISPMVDCIRNEPEYAEFLKNAEARYLEEHYKVEKLLREEGILYSSKN